MHLSTWKLNVDACTYQYQYFSMVLLVLPTASPPPRKATSAPNDRYPDSRRYICRTKDWVEKPVCRRCQDETLKNLHLHDKISDWLRNCSQLATALCFNKVVSLLQVVNLLSTSLFQQLSTLLSRQSCYKSVNICCEPSCFIHITVFLICSSMKNYV